ncbi:MAG: hypothetical protein GOU99_03505 [Candidatus Altiarchaeota archaeon]|nr:hypothetical protein [Candidatus Altiarchaeota archaeon]
MDINFLLILSGLLVFSGFIANLLFERTKIPDALYLIILGFILSAVGLVDVPSFVSIMGLMSSLALATIVFEAGLELDFKNLLTSFAPAISFATASFLFSAALIGGVVFFILKWDPLTSLLVGTLLGGTSTAIVVPIVHMLGFGEEEIALIGIESTTTNIYNVVFTLSIAELLLKATSTAESAVQAVFSHFSVGIVLGGIFGLFWVRGIRKLRGRKFSYMLTLSTMLILYGLTSYVGGSGAVSVLVFGLMLGNSRELTKLLHMPKVAPDRFLQIHQEITFLIRTYFFLYLGSILRLPSQMNLWYAAVLISVFALLARNMAVKLLKVPKYFSMLIPRGLSESVVAVLLIQKGIAHGNEILMLVSLVILLSNLIFGGLIRVSDFRVIKPGDHSPNHVSSKTSKSS